MLETNFDGFDEGVIFGEVFFEAFEVWDSCQDKRRGQFF